MGKLQRGIGDVTGWLDWIKQTIADLKGSGDFESGDLLEKYADTFASMGADVAEAVKDGFQFSDIYEIGKLLPEIMAIAKDIDGATNEQKHQFAVDAVWLIYHSVDTGPDGKQNRIKVPGAHWLSKFGITEPEEKLERFVLKFATDMSIKAAYDLFAKDSEDSE